MNGNNDILALLAYVKAKQGGGSAEAVKAVDTEGLIGGMETITIAPRSLYIEYTKNGQSWYDSTDPVENTAYPDAYAGTITGAIAWKAYTYDDWRNVATDEAVTSWIDPITGDTVAASSFKVEGEGSNVYVPPMQVLVTSEETTVQALLDEIARRVVEQIEAGAITGILGTAHGGTGNASGYVQAGKVSGSTVGTAATAEGISTTASGNYSHAEGYYSIASGINSHAEGNGAEATGSASHAEGSGTIASGDASHAEGNGTAAKSACQHVFGRYNVWDTSDAYIEVVGNGTMPGSQSNARTLDWSGNETLAGAIDAVNLHTFVLRNQTLVFSNLVATVSDSRVTADSYCMVYFDTATIGYAAMAGVVVDSGAGVITFTAATTPSTSLVCDIVVRNP